RLCADPLDAEEVIATPTTVPFLPWLLPSHWQRTPNRRDLMNRMWHHPKTRLALALLALAGAAWLLLPPAASAQTATGATLSGKVADNKKAPLPGVPVNDTNKTTGFPRVTVTAEDGGFRLPSLPVGVYTVTAELQGFATVTVEAVELTVATERRLEVTLSPATLAENITVVDEA